MPFVRIEVAQKRAEIIAAFRIRHILSDEGDHSSPRIRTSPVRDHPRNGRRRHQKIPVMEMMIVQFIAASVTRLEPDKGAPQRFMSKAFVRFPGCVSEPVFKRRAQHSEKARFQRLIAGSISKLSEDGEAAES